MQNSGMLRLLAAVSGPTMAQQASRYARAVPKAVTGLAFDVRDALRDEMGQVFDNPNAFTLNAFRVAAAGADGEAVVWAMPRQAMYLRWEVEGGSRASKGFEHKMGLFGGRVAVPVGKFDAQFDRSPKGFVGRVIREAEAGKQSGRYFVGTPKGGSRDAGVWARAGRGGRSLVKVMSFEDNASYAERLDIEAVARRTAGLRWESQLLRAMGAT